MLCRGLPVVESMCMCSACPLRSQEKGRTGRTNPPGPARGSLARPVWGLERGPGGSGKTAPAALALPKAPIDCG